MSASRLNRAVRQAPVSLKNGHAGSDISYMMRAKAAGLAFFGMLYLAAFASAGTPHGRPGGISAAAPTGLTMRRERTELTFLRDSARVLYVSRAELVNPGRERRLELRLDFVDASGRYVDFAVEHGPPHGAPTFEVRVDGRPVLATCDTIGDMHRLRWSFTAARRGRIAVEARAAFPWIANACAAPDHQMDWRPVDGSVIDVSDATREMVFRFVPPVSFMAVETWTDSAVFERGAVRWRWHGRAIEAFDLQYDSEFADEHTELFPGPYRLSWDQGLANRYFEVFTRTCEKSDLDLDEGRDSLSTAGRSWVEDARSSCRSVILSLRARHALAPLDTASSGLPPLGQPGLADSALSALNPVERRNLRYAVGMMWALDTSKTAEEIFARAQWISPGRWPRRPGRTRRRPSFDRAAAG